MSTSQERILTTHVGSLVRPPELSRYIEAIDNGVKVDQAAFNRCPVQSVAEGIRRQQQAGVDVVSDGEFGKFRSWSFYVLDRLGGIEEREVEAARGAGRDQQMFADFYAEYFPTQKLPELAPSSASARSRTRAARRSEDLQGGSERRGRRRYLSSGGRADNRGAATQERILSR